MAIDSTVLAADIPAGTYALGDIIPLGVVDGPSVVRSGRGSAILKRIFSGATNYVGLGFKIHIKNSNWVDEVQNVAATLNAALTVFDHESGCSQSGHDCNLTPNSTWEAYAEVIVPGTSTLPCSLIAQIDVDYPEVGSIAEPVNVAGVPCSIPLNFNVTSNTFGTMRTAGWTVQNVDYFKAGAVYALDAVETLLSSNTALGFIAFSGAAGMGGLTRIIPFQSTPDGIRFPVEYSSKLVKGPMDVKIKIFDTTAAAVNVYTVHDYVKRA